MHMLYWGDVDRMPAVPKLLSATIPEDDPVLARLREQRLAELQGQVEAAAHEQAAAETEALREEELLDANVELIHADALKLDLEC